MTQLQKQVPGFTVGRYLGNNASDNPTFVSGRDRVAEGLRKAGLPEGSPSPAAVRPQNWCTGVNIVAILDSPDPGLGDFGVEKIHNGYRQAEFDLGPSVTYAYWYYSANEALAALKQAIESKADGVVIPGLLPVDAATDALIDRAFEQGTIVTSGLPIPSSQAKHSSEGMGFVGTPSPRDALIGFAHEAIRRAGLKKGDKVFVWGAPANAGAWTEASRGVAEALEKAELKVVYLEIDTKSDWGADGPTARFDGVLRANPDVKAVIIVESFLTAHAAYFARTYGLKPGQLFIAGLDLYPGTVQGIKDGYVNLVYDNQQYLWGYLPILNICLTKKFGFSGLPITPAVPYVDASNIDAIAPLAERNIR